MQRNTTINKKYLRMVLVLAGALFASYSNVGAKSSEYPIFSTEAERCILPAAELHGVNSFVLRAILKIESGLKPNAVGKNRNGTVDVGIGQMNSMHFPELVRVGVAPEWLKDACVGTYVAAWHLSKAMARYGNTWYGVASYHSATPYFNRRYQIMLNNELVKSGVIAGRVFPVPPLR